MGRIVASSALRVGLEVFEQHTSPPPLLGVRDSHAPSVPGPKMASTDSDVIRKLSVMRMVTSALHFQVKT